MDRERFEATLSRLFEAGPFRPFTISMLNGEKFEVDFPNALAFRGGIATYISSRGVPIFFDHEGVSHIARDLARVEPL
jgi:hypothetical protein